MIYLVKRSLTSLRGFTTTFIRKPDMLIIKYQKTYTDPDGEQYTYTYNASSITLNYLKSRNDFKDYSSFGLYTRDTVLENLGYITDIFDTAKNGSWSVADLKGKLTSLFEYSINGYPYSATNLVNLTAITMESRSDFRGIRTIVSGTRLMRFFVPFTNMDFTKMPIVVALCPGNEFVCNEDTELISNDDNIVHPAMESWMKKNSVLPTLRFSINGEITNEYELIGDPATTVTVELVDEYTNKIITGYETEIYLEHVNGFVPYDRVRINPETGTGQFNVSGYGMIPGDTFRVKAGFRYYPGVTDITFHTSH